MSIGLEEVCQLHEAVMEAAGEERGALPPRHAARLQQALDMAALWPETGADTVRCIAAVGAGINRVEAFSAGNMRTALMVMATLMQRSGRECTDDWSRVAAVLVESHGSLPAAIAALAEALLPR